MSARQKGEERVNLPMAGGSDEVEQSVHTIVSEARITLDTRLLSKDIIVLPLQIADDLCEAAEELLAAC